MRTSSLILAALAGFLGGSIASRFTTVHAQAPGSGGEILQSKAFVLLDGSGHKRGEWKTEQGQPALRLFDKQGRVMDTIGTPHAELTQNPH